MADSYDAASSSAAVPSATSSKKWRRARGGLTFPKLAAFILKGYTLERSYRPNFFARYVEALTAVIFVYFLGKLFTTPPAVGDAYGVDYFTFALVGTAFSQYFNIVFRQFALGLREEMLTGTVEPLLVTVTHPTLALLGGTLWTLIEGLFILFFQLGLGWLLGARLGDANWAAALLVTLLALVSFGAWGIASAGFVLIFKKGDPIAWLVAGTTFIFGGVYFPVTLLPPWLRIISYLLPVTYALEAIRGALFLGSTLAQLAVPLLALTGFMVVLLPVSLFLFRHATRRARREGSLAHY